MLSGNIFIVLNNNGRCLFQFTDEENSILTSDTLASVNILPTSHRLGFSIDTEFVSLETNEPDSFPVSDSSDFHLTRSDSILCEAKFKISDVAVQVRRSHLEHFVFAFKRTRVV